MAGGGPPAEERVVEGASPIQGFQFRPVGPPSLRFAPSTTLCGARSPSRRFAGEVKAGAQAARVISASRRIRATMEARPFDRWADSAPASPSSAKAALASKLRISPGVRPE